MPAPEDRVAKAPPRRDPASDEQLADAERAHWDAFYDDRERPCPFFGLAPDESLAAWVGDGRLGGGHAVDIGCGNGRNAIFLARHGYRVLAIDASPSATKWAEEEVAKARVPVAVRQVSVFEAAIAVGAFDLLYDSGCFHHMPPRQRTAYIDLCAASLRPGGHLGLVCFAPEGGSGYTDMEVEARGSLGGGLGYDAQRLRDLWSPAFEIVELRRMRDQDPNVSRFFGRSFLWAMLGVRRSCVDASHAHPARDAPSR